MKAQRTIAHSISCSGTGLHSGEMVTITLHPSDEDTGIVFVRSDLPNHKNIIPARFDRVTNTKLGTTIENEQGVQVGTIEHLMAAFWGAHIDNCIVEINGGEVPIMDGSSEPFTFLIECAGVEVQNKPKKYIEILEEISVSDEQTGASLTLFPSTSFIVSLEIDFDNPAIAKQKGLFDANRLSFKNTLSRARTFGFAKEVDYLRSIGLARGGSLKNAIVVGDDGIMNHEGLRYSDEFVRHKILDCIGDMYLAGATIQGYIKGYKSGHCLNNKLLRTLFLNQKSWRYKVESITESLPYHSDAAMEAYA